MINAALNGKIDHVPTSVDPIFGLFVPERVDGVPEEILLPRNTWADKNAYDEKAKDLAGRFHKNFEQFTEQAAPEVVAAGPRVGQ